jgi:hypothetical protein
LVSAVESQQLKTYYYRDILIYMHIQTENMEMEKNTADLVHSNETNVFSWGEDGGGEAKKESLNTKCV